MKLTRVTPAGLEGFEELSTAYKLLVSEAQSGKKPQNQRLPYKLVDRSAFVRLRLSCGRN